MRYDLLTEAWIPVTDDSGMHNAGIFDALAHSHCIRAICAPSPLVTFGIYRLLIAIVHWIDPIRSTRQWRLRWRGGRFSARLLEAVRRRAASKFDLFDHDRPFYQHPGSGSGKRAELKPVSYLNLSMPTETFVNHFRHVYDDDFVKRGAGFCPACCAKGLVSLSPFAPQGGSGKPRSINGEPPEYVLPAGPSLYETLLLSLPIAELQSVWGQPVARGDPAWERPLNTQPANASGPVGLVEGLTWQPRRACLMPQAAQGVPCAWCGQKCDVLVRRMAFPKGGDSRGPRESARQWTDPHALADEDRALRPSDWPSFWRRRLRALLQLQTDEPLHSPPLVRQLHSLLASEACPLDALAVDHYHTTSYRAALTGWGAGSLALSAAVLKDNTTREAVVDALDCADELANAVRRQLVPPDWHNSVLCEFSSAVREVLEPQLAGLKPGGECAQAFLQSTGVAFRQVAEAAVQVAGTVPRALGRWGRSDCEQQFARQLDRILRKGGAA